MKTYLSGGLITPFVTVAIDQNWILKVVLEELFDRMEIHPSDMDMILIAENSGNEGELARHFQSERTPIFTITSPRCPFSRALYLAYHLIQTNGMSSIVIASVNRMDVNTHVDILKEGEELAQQFALEREKLDDWAWRSRQRFSDQSKQNPNTPWKQPVIFPDGTMHVSRDSLLDTVEDREELSEKNRVFPPDHTVITRGNSASFVYAAGAVMITSNSDQALVEISGAASGHATKRLSSLSSVFAIPAVIQDMSKSSEIIIPEPTAAHSIALSGLLQNESFCSDYLGMSNIVLENSDRINPRGGELAYGWSPGPGEIRRLLDQAHTMSSTSIILENDISGQGFVFSLRGS